MDRPVLIRITAQLASVFASAAAFVVFGVVLADIMEAYALTLAQGGFVAVIRTSGEVAAALLMTYAVRFIGAWRTFLLGNVSIALSHVLLIGAWPYSPFLLLLFLSGMGVQFVTTPVAAMMGAIDPKRPGRYVGLVFLCIGLGVMLTPLVSGWRLEAGDSWRALVALIGVLFVGLTALHLGLGPVGHVEARETALKPKLLLTNPRLWMIGLSIFVWVASHITLVTWLPTYALTELGTGRQLAGVLLASYSFGILLSRLAVVAIADRFSTRRVMMALAAIGSLFAVGMVTATHIHAVIPFTFLLGLANGAMIPLFFVLAGKYLSSSPSVFSMIFAALLIGETTAPGVAGWLAGHIGLRSSFWMVVIALVATVLLLALFPMVTRSREGEEPIQSNTSPG